MPETKFPPGCPVYSRIAEQIAGRIESGGIKEGERLSRSGGCPGNWEYPEIR